MTPDCLHFEGDWEMLALGALDPAREQELRAHLDAGCPHCQRRLAESASVVRSLASTVPLARPSEAAGAALSMRVRASEAAARPGPRRTLLPWFAAAAALLLAAGLGGEVLRLRNQLSRSVEQAAVRAIPKEVVREVIREVPAPQPQTVTREVTREVPKEVIREVIVPKEVVREVVKEVPVEVRVPVEVKVPGPVRIERDPLLIAELDRTKAQLAEYRRVFRALEGTGLRQVDLKVVDSGGGRATARAILSPDGGLILFARDLPKLPGKKCYQLWLVHNASPSITSAGLLQVDDAGRGLLVAPPGVGLRDVTGLAITDEPEGGSASSRGRKLLFGAL